MSIQFKCINTKHLQGINEYLCFSWRSHCQTIVVKSHRNHKNVLSSCYWSEGGLSWKIHRQISRCRRENLLFRLDTLSGFSCEIPLYNLQRGQNNVRTFARATHEFFKRIYLRIYDVLLFTFSSLPHLPGVKFCFLLAPSSCEHL